MSMRFTVRDIDELDVVTPQIGGVRAAARGESGAETPGPWALVTTRGLAHLVGDAVKVVVVEREPDEEHVARDQHRLHHARECALLSVEPEVVVSTQDEAVRVGD